MEAKLLPIAMIEPNEGQIKGLPRNPRFIRDERYEKLKQSICDAPEMMDMRSLIVVQHKKRYVVICGNMRLRACRELEYEELPCYVLPETTPVRKLQEYTIKDNIGFGQTDWDIIANEWNVEMVKNWGMETIILDGGQWADLSEIDGNLTPPALEKGIKILLIIPEEQAEKEEEIRMELHKLEQKYNVKVK